jgi:hypothetical protein
MPKIHKFLVQIEDGENTRWQFDDEEFSRVLACGTTNLICTVTTGKLPQVTAIPEENRNPIDERVASQG